MDELEDLRKSRPQLLTPGRYVCGLHVNIVSVRIKEMGQNDVENIRVICVLQTGP